jgi:dodecin
MILEMTILPAHDYTGYSESSLNEAIANALRQAEEDSQFKVIETCSSHFPDNKCQYHVTLTAFNA